MFELFVVSVRPFVFHQLPLLCGRMIQGERVVSLRMIALAASGAQSDTVRAAPRE
jgi:hypothetical protein